MAPVSKIIRAKFKNKQNYRLQVNCDQRLVAYLYYAMAEFYPLATVERMRNEYSDGGEMDDRDRAIVLAIATQWADHGRCTYRDVARITGVPLTNVCWRVKGYEWQGVRAKRVGGGLADRGWVTIGEFAPGWSSRPAASLSPGPKFGGMQRESGRIYTALPV